MFKVNEQKKKSMKMPKNDYDKGSNRYGIDNGFVIVVSTNHGSMNSYGAARTL